MKLIEFYDIVFHVSSKSNARLLFVLGWGEK
jgi:hypothetical protein